MVIVKCTKRTGLKEFFGEKCFGTYMMANVDGWQPLETISYLLIWLIAYKLSPLKFQLRFSLWLAYYPPDFSLQFGFLKYEWAEPLILANRASYQITCLQRYPSDVVIINEENFLFICYIYFSYLV